MILGTAGHVDHGKTALVKALTGVDTDRLEEERRRGITIDLGFAPLRLPGGLTLGVVDVPGHEAFVRNMLAGATGLDLALLVVAADEGIMPQTAEHLQILSLLGIRGGVVALSKADLVDAEWLAMVADDVRSAIAGTPLAQAQLVATSAVTGLGVDELRAALVVAARDLPERDADDLFRLPVDRAFSVRGTGTVVTGTAWSGTLRRDATVRLLPGNRTARVRALQSHGAAVDRVDPGSRAAIALAGIELAEVHRGTVLVSDPAWHETQALLAEVVILDDADAILTPTTRVRFHLGTTDVGARVVAASGELHPGARAQARLVVDEPVVARAGDRFVLRSASPIRTIGGGIINDPLPVRRRARPWRQPAATASERLEHALQQAGAHGVEVATLPVRLGAPRREIETLLGHAGAEIRRVGDRVYHERAIGEVGERLTGMVDAHHRSFPLEEGMPLQSLRSRLGIQDVVVDQLVAERVSGGELRVAAGLISRAGWSPRLTPAQVQSRTELLETLARARREPPSVSELAERTGSDTMSLLRLLERSGKLVQVEPDRFFVREAVEEMVELLRRRMAPGRVHAPAELRDVLGLSRKYLIPFLEYCDRTQVTERRADGRVLMDG